MGSINLLPPDLIEKYSMVAREEILDAVELATIRVMQQVHRTPASAVIDEEEGVIWVTLLKDGAQFAPIDLSKIRSKVRRRLTDEIEQELMRRQTIAESNRYHTLTRATHSGTILSSQKGILLVELEVRDGLNILTINAACPPSHQTSRDFHRGAYKPGSILTFYALSARPVENGRRSWVQVTVSRKAKELPARMLESITGLPGIKCIERSPGHRSRIVTRHPLPKTAINQVGKELMETLEVTCPGLTKPFFRI